jgi:hypothetical protein
LTATRVGSSHDNMLNVSSDSNNFRTREDIASLNHGNFT